MTILKRLMRVVGVGSGLNAGFEQYYSKLMIGRVGDTGLPTASEALRDRDAAMTTPHYYVI